MSHRQLRTRTERFSIDRELVALRREEVALQTERTKRGAAMLALLAAILAVIVKVSPGHKSSDTCSHRSPMTILMITASDASGLRRLKLDPNPRRGYGNYMSREATTKPKAKPGRRLELKVVRIGNSRGIRLPKALLQKYAIGDAVLVEENERGLLLRSTNDVRMSWEETYREMAASREDWTDWEAVVGDGLDKEPW
jgi:antitoxin MazE